MDKRMAGDYEIIHAFHIGDQEVVLGENPNAVPEERYPSSEPTSAITERTTVPTPAEIRTSTSNRWRNWC